MKIQKIKIQYKNQLHKDYNGMKLKRNNDLDQNRVLIIKQINGKKQKFQFFKIFLVDIIIQYILKKML